MEEGILYERGESCMELYGTGESYVHGRGESYMFAQLTPLDSI